MRRLLFSSLILFASLSAAQTPSSVAAEPHHHLLLQNDQVRVYLLTLAYTEQIFVRHDHNFLFIPLQNGELVIWGKGASAVPHYLFHRGEVHFWLAGTTAGMRNDRATDFRAVIVEFLNPKVNTYQYDSYGSEFSGGWNYASGAINPPVDPHTKFVDSMLMGAATASDVQLLANDPLPPPSKAADELLIAVTDLDLRANDDTLIHKASGDVLWIPAGRTWPLTNAASTPARFTAVALWKVAN